MNINNRAQIGPILQPVGKEEIAPAKNWTNLPLQVSHFMEGMMAAALPKTYITVDEYLDGEEISDVKHEYYNGEVFALAGASESHNATCFNVAGSLYTQLRGRDCRAYPSDMRVKTAQKTSLYTYPDLSVVCGKAKFETEKRNTLLNPTVIFEVLSPSAEGYDRGAKFESYRTILSLQEYVLIAQDRSYLEHHIRQPDGRWLLAEYHKMQDVVQLPSIECNLLLEDIYEKVEFVDADSTPS